MSEIAMPAAAEPKRSKSDSKRAAKSTPWRDNIEAMLMAIIMAIVLKFFLVEAYRIPTGSMQPTLMGNDAVGVYDRILVDKFSYKMRAPERFEVAVFRFPLDRSKNYVKRIVGVGPEFFRVRFGDLWRRDSEDQPWSIIRRPAHVQAETWLALAKSEPEKPLFYDANSVGTGHRGGRDFELLGNQNLRFGPQRTGIKDTYNDGYPDSIKDSIRAGSASHSVGDLRIEGQLEVSATTEWVTFEFQEGALRYDLRLPGPAAPAEAAPQILVRDGNQLLDSPLIEAKITAGALRLNAGETYAFAAQNLDDELLLELDGQLLCSAEIEPNPEQIAGLYIQTQGGTTRFGDVMVYRDIYYTEDNCQVTETFIPEGSYFMMGDNTLDSSDSRMWQLHRLNTLDNAGAEELLVGSNHQNPQTNKKGSPDLREITWFRDQWGEMHTFEADETFPADPGTELAPFVRRDQILGRAIAVFWPIKPLDRIFRFKRVD